MIGHVRRSRLPLRVLVAVLFLTAVLAPEQLRGQDAQRVIAAPNAQSPTSVTTADLDGDGTKDMLSSSFEDDKIAWYENRIGASGNDDGFADQRVITTDAKGAAAVATADLDGDGKRDVLSASFKDGKVAWYDNQIGDTDADDDGFGPQHTIATDLEHTQTITSADVDGDDQMDVIAASDTEIVWFENQIGEGDADADGFGSPRVIASDAAPPRTVTTVDVDGDGTVDVLAASGTEIVWYKNQTAGSDADSDGFGPRRTIATGLKQAWSVAAADLDGDGDPDVLSASNHEVAWHENVIGEDGANSDEFGPQRMITIATYRARALATADLDGDGDIDVLSASEGDDTIGWYENRIDETGDRSSDFGAQQVIHTRAERAWSVAAADLDGDDTPDVLSASFQDDTVAWYANEVGQSGGDDAGFGSSRSVTTGAIGARSVAAADLDGDGNLDVLSASEGDDTIAWYENQIGEGEDNDDRFGSQQVITSDAWGATSVATADLDGDGTADVLSASFLDDTIAWYENQIDESGGDPDGFGPQRVITTDASSAQSVTATDLDGDGDPDVLSASSNDVAWYENQIGEGGGEDRGFAPRRVITSNVNGATSVTTADLDGDGTADVLSASSFDNKIAWYDNQIGESGGDPDGFGPQRVITTDARGAQSVATADLDGDDTEDVLSASALDNKIAWYDNQVGKEEADRDGFGPQQVITTDASSAASVAATDLDGDGNEDVFSASMLDNKISWYKSTPGKRGGAPSEFGDERVVTTDAKGAVSVAAADLNGTGDKDLLVASLRDDQVGWYWNDGEGIIPVELVAFDARVADGVIRLTWETASETGNAEFRLQRRTPQGARTASAPQGNSASNWQTIGRVDGAGTTSQPQSYRFTDERPPYEATQILYRLKQIDVDGSIHYSDPVTVRREGKTIQLLPPSPNPAPQQVTVRYTIPSFQADTRVTVRLYDVLGRAVRTVAHEKTAGRYEHTLDVSNLSSGVYFLRLRSGSTSQTKKVTVVE